MLTRSKKKQLWESQVSAGLSNIECDGISTIVSNKTSNAGKTELEITSTPVSRFVKRTKLRHCKTFKKVSVIFSSPESDGMSDYDKMVSRCENCSDEFDLQQWDLELALQYIESAQKALSDKEFAMKSPCQVSKSAVNSKPCKTSKASGKKRTKKLLHAVSENSSPEWSLEDAAKALLSCDIDDPFPREKYPYLLKDIAAKKAGVHQPSMLSCGYIQRSIDELLARRKLNEEWFQYNRRNPWTKDCSLSPFASPNVIPSREVVKKIFSIREATVEAFPVPVNAMNPINLVVYYGSSRFELLLVGCDSKSDQFYTIMPRIFSLWNGQLYGLNDRIAVTGRTVPRCFRKFAINADMILSQEQDVIEVIFCYADYSCLLSVDEKTTVMEIMSYCLYFLPIHINGTTIHGIQIFSDADKSTPLNSEATYGNVVDKFGKVAWYVFYADENCDWDVTQLDLPDKNIVSDYMDKWDNDGFSEDSNEHSNL